MTETTKNPYPEFFYLGQRVTTVKTGLPRIGHVCSITYGTVYKGIMERVYGPLTAWNELFPGWENKFVYQVWFDDKAKSMNKEEFQRCHPDLTEYELEEQYNNLPPYNPVSFCQDDLATAEDVEIKQVVTLCNLGEK